MTPSDRETLISHGFAVRCPNCKGVTPIVLAVGKPADPDLSSGPAPSCAQCQGRGIIPTGLTIALKGFLESL